MCFLFQPNAVETSLRSDAICYSVTGPSHVCTAKRGWLVDSPTALKDVDVWEKLTTNMRNSNHATLIACGDLGLLSDCIEIARGLHARSTRGATHLKKIAKPGKCLSII